MQEVQHVIYTVKRVQRQSADRSYTLDALQKRRTQRLTQWLPAKHGR